MITGYGTTNGFEIKLLDKTGGDLNNFFQIYQRFIAALNAVPKSPWPTFTFNPSFPQYMVDIDVAKVKQAGLGHKMQCSLRFRVTTAVCMCQTSTSMANSHRVMMRGDPEARVSPETLKQIKIRNGNQMAPIDNFVKLTRAVWT